MVFYLGNADLPQGPAVNRQTIVFSVTDLCGESGVFQVTFPVIRGGHGLLFIVGLTVDGTQIQSDTNADISDIYRPRLGSRPP
jgi:hypothetical protein